MPKKKTAKTLPPCPGCGDLAVSHRISVPSEWWEVTCRNDDCSFETSGESQEIAEAHWSRRVDSTVKV